MAGKQADDCPRDKSRSPHSIRGRQSIRLLASLSDQLSTREASTLPRAPSRVVPGRRRSSPTVIWTSALWVPPNPVAHPARGRSPCGCEDFVRPPETLPRPRFRVSPGSLHPACHTMFGHAVVDGKGRIDDRRRLLYSRNRFRLCRQRRFRFGRGWRTIRLLLPGQAPVRRSHPDSAVSPEVAPTSLRSGMTPGLLRPWPALRSSRRSLASPGPERRSHSGSPGACNRVPAPAGFSPADVLHRCSAPARSAARQPASPDPEPIGPPPPVRSTAPPVSPHSGYPARRPCAAPRALHRIAGRSTVSARAEATLPPPPRVPALLPLTAPTRPVPGLPETRPGQSAPVPARVHNRRARSACRSAPPNVPSTPRGFALHAGV